MLNIVNHQRYPSQEGKIVYLRVFTALESATGHMTVKDERIGFRVSSDIKASLLHIAKKEDRSLAQICELLLKAGINEYEKAGSNYLHRVLSRVKKD